MTNKFPIAFKVKEWLPVTCAQEFYWKTVCTVDTNEQLGYMERLFQRADVEYKTEPVS